MNIIYINDLVLLRLLLKLVIRNFYFGRLRIVGIQKTKRRVGDTV